MNRTPDTSPDKTDHETAPDAEAADESATRPAPGAGPDEGNALAEAAIEQAETSAETGVEAARSQTPAGAVPGAAVVEGGTQVTAAVSRTGGDAINAPAPGAEHARRSVARSAGIVSVSVMGSRVLGLVRDQLFAYYFGAGFLKDAFLVGFRIPNMLRDLFAEGALSAAFVKTFTDYLEKGGATEKEREEAAWRLASMVMNALAVVLSAVTVLGVIFSPQIVDLIAPGFPAEKAQLATTLTRIMFPFILLVALAAVAMGVLNTKGRFGIPASASTLFNVGSIIGGLGCAYWLSGGGWARVIPEGVVPDAPAQWAIIGMAIGTLIGGALQFLIQVPSLLRVGFRFRPLVSFTDPGVGRVARLMAPAIIGTAATQVNVAINTFYASGIEAGPSWLDFSFRLMQLPLGIFGVAIGTATTPVISRFASRGDIPNFRTTLSSSIGLVFLLTIPSACGLVVLGEPIVALIFQRGAFTAIDTRMVAAALNGYAAGLVGYAAIKVLSPAFYALDDARTPMLVSLFSIAVNAVAGYFLRALFSTFGATPETPSGYAHAGLALSTSLVAIVNFFALVLFMRRRIKRLEGRRIFSSFVRIALASLALSAASYLMYRWLFNFFGGRGLGARLVETFVPMAAGGVVFFVAARLLRVQELDQALRAVAGRFMRRAER
ncbi:MAG: murein biosynthesis integral membrane protein MurJ [Pyrinomonadaceae bacterium]